jgi:glycosyltransferase involved in cell wall biosynthesis
MKIESTNSSDGALFQKFILNKKVPRVSVIVPSYNREKLVVKAIDSVLRQKYTDYELIVVDDGSTDNTKEILKNYGKRVEYIYQDNAGVSSARNAGIARARGEWIAFLDSDDEWGVDYLSKQMEKVNANAQICMQATNCLYIDINGDATSYFEINGAIKHLRAQDYLLFEDPFKFVILHMPWQLGSIIIKKQTLYKAGLFDINLRLSEDLDIVARVALHGAFGIIKETLVYIYRRNEVTECLTNQARLNPITCREINEQILLTIKHGKKLKFSDRRTLNGVISRNRRAIGNLFLENDDHQKAMNSFKKAMMINPSIKAIGRYILSLFLKRLIPNKFLR